MHLLFKSSYHCLIAQILMKTGKLCRYLTAQNCVKNIKFFLVRVHEFGHCYKMTFEKSSDPI